MRIRYWKGLSIGAVASLMTWWLTRLAQFSKRVAQGDRDPRFDPSRSHCGKAFDRQVASPIGCRRHEQLCAEDWHG